MFTPIAYDCCDRHMFLGDLVQGSFTNLTFKGVLALDLSTYEVVVRTYPEDIPVLIDCITDLCPITGIERLKPDFDKNAVNAFRDKVLSELDYYIKEINYA